MIDDNELEKRFGFHPPKDLDTAMAHEKVREVCLEAAESLVRLAPECREQSLAITALEEAMMWANAAIARNQGEELG